MKSLLRSLLRPRLGGTALGVWAALAVSPAAAALFTELSPGPEAEAAYPAESRFLAVELEDLRAWLSAAPRENFDNPVPGLPLALPMPGGYSADFEVWEAPVMHAELQARFPEIRTYRGVGLDDPYATVRLDVTPAGFHAMVLSAEPTVFIDPLERGDDRVHVTHFKRTAAESPDASFRCDFVPDPVVEREIAELVETRRGLRQTGEQLRTYRTAVAATGEYTNFHGGTVPSGLAAIVTSVNRVTGVYEKEVSVRLELIPNNDLIVYTNPATDPYTNNNGSIMLGENQANLNAVIGFANYDIGHVFSTGGGGIASLAVVCNNSAKARGVTGRTQPIGDNFDIDYVAHEIGHQFAATHTFNGNEGSCNGNRTGSTAFEPGSGTTIMAYAGICGSQNLALHSHDNFHLASFLQITSFTQGGGGNSCAAITNTGNLPPSTDAGNVGLTIPIETPFLLHASSIEPDGDPISHNWEEYDLGPAGHPDSPSGNAPILRSWPPHAERDWRMFPRPFDVRTNVHTLGELLPTYTRTLQFRVSVRDGLGGVGWDATTLNVSDAAGPFLVTSIDATPWASGSTKTITWDVAGTSAAPVSCANVNILLSTDDGRDFPTTLLANTPNDGSEDIVVPGLPTDEARVKVEAVGNVFFDMNDDGFEITGTTDVEVLASASDDLAVRVHPNPFAERASISFATAQRGEVNVSVFDTAGRRVATLMNAMRDAGTHSVVWNGRDAAAERVSAGVYFVRVESADGTRSSRVVHLQ